MGVFVFKHVDLEIVKLDSEHHSHMISHMCTASIMLCAHISAHSYSR